jgi:flavin-dependent dehydrogenase
MGWIFWYEIGFQSRDSWAKTAQAIIQSVPTIGASAAIVTVSAIEGQRFIMVVGDWLEERIRKNRERDLEKARLEGREEGREEGRKELRTKQAERARRLVESGDIPAEALELLFPDDSEAAE